MPDPPKAVPGRREGTEVTIAGGNSDELLSSGGCGKRHQGQQPKTYMDPFDQGFPRGTLLGNGDQRSSTIPTNHPMDRELSGNATEKKISGVFSFRPGSSRTGREERQLPEQTGMALPRRPVGTDG